MAKRKEEVRHFASAGDWEVSRPIYDSRGYQEATEVNPKLTEWLRDRRGEWEKLVGGDGHG